MIKLNLILTLVLLISCSNLNFKSSQKISTTFDYKPERTQEVSIKVTKHFYMWGLYPNKHTIDVDKVFLEKGFDSVSDLKINEIKTVDKAVWSVITLGMYYPESYMLVGKTN